MKDITQNFGPLYYPTSALVFYKSNERNQNVYVEHFDMDINGNPINAHPLTVNESKNLSKALTLNLKKEKSMQFLKPQGILPTNVLHLNVGEKASLIWFTKQRRQQLYFINNLEIPNGTAEVPALVWFANKKSLRLFAVKINSRPSENTLLFNAPFFNVYQNGVVCMGTVDVNIRKSASLEEFMKCWEDYFFNSYFSHLMNGHNLINGNCVSLWKSLINTDKQFPKNVLKKTNLKLIDLIK